MCQLDYPFNKYHNHCLIFFCQCDTLKCQITIRDTIRNSCFEVWMDIFVFQLGVMSLHCLIVSVCVSVFFILCRSAVGLTDVQYAFGFVLLGAQAQYSNRYDVNKCLSVMSR